MPWNPDVYNQFKEKRYEPFYDLISHITAEPGMSAIDLGCGTGELTRTMADKFPGIQMIGIDSSAQMLARAPQHEKISFVQRSVEEQLELPDHWDIIVANASLQWVEDHPALFPKLISRLKPGGQLAVQMPSQKENRLNQLLLELVQKAPFYEALKGEIRQSPLLSLDDYTSLLYSNGATKVLVYQKVYPIIAQSTDTLYEFIAGSALVPYMEKLSSAIQPGFVQAFKDRIAEAFPAAPMVYAFKRLILAASF